MKVSLVRIPTIIDAFASTAPICPPIGLAYLKRVVSAFAKEIQIIDSVGNFPKIRSIVSEGYSCKLIGQTKDEIIDLLWSDADIVLVSCMFSHDWKYACSILKGIRTKCSQALVIAGGEHITAVPEYSMKSSVEIDVCVLGGGESIIHDVLEAFLGNKQDLKTVPGTYIRNGASEIIKNIINTRIRRKDKIFWPDWEGFPLFALFSKYLTILVTTREISQGVLGSILSGPDNSTTQIAQDNYHIVMFLRDSYFINCQYKKTLIDCFSVLLFQEILVNCFYRFPV